VTETTLVDFTSEIASPVLSVTRRIARNGIVVSRCDIPINPGTQIVTAQFALFMHESEPLDLICRSPESRRTEKYPVAAGHFHLSPADRAAHVGWTADKQSFVIAMENSFIERTIGNAFDGRVPEIRGRAALRDPAIEELIACLRRSLIDNSRCGGLCLDLVGTSLALRLFETYGENSKPPPSIRGGLGASRRRRMAVSHDVV
jgi:AraC family transcriptional regulator